MRGSLTELKEDRSKGTIVGENGGIIYLYEETLNSAELKTISVGDWIEYEEDYLLEYLRARNPRRIANPASQGKPDSNKK